MFFLIAISTAFIVWGDAFLQQLAHTRRLSNFVRWQSQAQSPPQYFVDFLKQQQADRLNDKEEREADRRRNKADREADKAEIMAQISDIKAEISDIKADRVKDRQLFERLSQKLSVLSEESVRKRVSKRRGESWAESVTIKSLEDLVEFIYPLLLGVRSSSKNSHAVKNYKSFFVLVLARKLRPYLKLYLDAVKSFLLKYYEDNTEKKLALSTLTEYSDLPGRLIGIVGGDNLTWRLRLLRLKEASHLINMENPSDEDLEALLSPTGPGVLLACGVAKEMYRDRRRISYFHRNALKVSDHHDLRNPFAALADPFVELKEEIEGDHAGECDLTDMTVLISVGEMKSSSDDISNARGQIALILSIYEWAFRTIAPDAVKRQTYKYVRKGEIYIPKTARRLRTNENENLYYDNGITYRVFYI